MKVWTGIENYRADSKRPLILALGNFDGVHLGHQAILKRVIRQAKKRKGAPAILTFFEHPQRVLHGSEKPALLTSLQHRLLLFREMGIEICFLLHFTLKFSKTSPERFVENILVNRLGVKEVHLGYNAHFGFGREGDVSLMRELAWRFGFGFFETQPIGIKGRYVSSSLIREMVSRGDLNEAKEFLGRPFTIFAKVIRGKGRGKSLGFPTANLKPYNEILPPQGVYPVEVRKRGFHLKPLSHKNEFELVQERPAATWKKGILNLGTRPTFDNADDTSNTPIPEVYLFNFKGDLYGQTLEVIFHPQLRKEKRFRDQDKLVQAIKQDILRAKEYFGVHR